jgi:hypothetical protein
MYYLVCKSLTYAQRAEAVLRAAGVRCTLLRSPRKISETGCSQSLRIPDKQLTQALVALRQARFSPIKVYLDGGDGTFREVAL